MSELNTVQKKADQHQRMQRYYIMQSKIYDLTRWTFLFGRKGIVRKIPLDRNTNARIVEVGCGTGFNLQLLANRFPKAHLTGIDVSNDMLNIARKNLRSVGNEYELHAAPYATNQELFEPGVDVILFSYSLTMINPQWEELIEQAYRDLKPGGYVAVADFYNSRFQWFKNHMGNHHVRMDSHLNPKLKTLFHTEFEQANNAYGGVWQYFYYLGQKKA
ncbi:MAG: class I SAM-dependent methyltransferase [Bacteroidota bacterium]